MGIENGTMITIDLDLSPAEQRLTKFTANLKALQAEVAAQTSGSGSPARQNALVLPPQVQQQIANPSYVTRDTSGSVVSQENALRLTIEKQAEAAALLNLQANQAREKLGLGSLSLNNAEETALLESSILGLKKTLAENDIKIGEKQLRTLFLQSAQNAELELDLAGISARNKVSPSTLPYINERLVASGIGGEASVARYGTVAKENAKQAELAATQTAAMAQDVAAVQARIVSDAERAAASRRAQDEIAAAQIAEAEAVAEAAAIQQRQADKEAASAQAINDGRAAQQEGNTILAEEMVRSSQQGKKIGDLLGSYAASLADDQASVAAFGSAMAGLVKQVLILDEQYSALVTIGEANLIAATRMQQALTSDAILKNPELRAQVAEGSARYGVNRSEQSLDALRFQQADEGLRDRSRVIQGELNARKVAEAAAVQQSVNEMGGAAAATVSLKNAKLANAVAVQEEMLSSEESLVAHRLLNARLKANAVAIDPGPQTVWQGIRSKVEAGGGNAAGLLGGGVATTLKFALPSAALFGSFAAIKEALKDSEELAITFTKLDSQLAGIDNADRLANLKKQIFDISSETGIMAAEIGDLALQIQGAFGDIKFDPNKISQGGLRGSDEIIRYGDEAVSKQIEAAGKLSVVTGIAQKELVDGLTAASFAFGTSADLIGDVSQKLEVSTGVKAKETISFLGDIGPVAEAAGFSLEEFAAIAAIAQKRSGSSGTALAEQFARIIPALTKDSQSFFDIANKNKEIFNSVDPKGYDKFVKAIQDSDTKGAFQGLAGVFDQLDKGSQDFIVQLIGGRREANALLSVFNDTSGLKKATEDAQNAAGTLNDRFSKLSQRITVIFNQLKVEFTKFAKFFVDSGFGKAVGLTLKELQTMLQIFNWIVKPVTAIDKALGGWGSNLAAVAIQLTIINTLMKAFSANAAEGAAVNIAGEAVAARSGGAAVGAAIFGGPARAAGRAANAYRLARTGIEAPPIPMSTIDAAGTATKIEATAALGRLAAAKAALNAVLSPLAVGVIGVTAVFAAYSFISEAVKNDKIAVEKLRGELEKSKKSSTELLEDAVKEGDNRTESNFEATVKRFTDSPFKKDLLEIAAIRKGVVFAKARAEASAVEGLLGDNGFYDVAAADTSGSQVAILSKMADRIGLDNRNEFAQSIKAVFASKEKRKNLISSLKAIKSNTPEEEAQINLLITALNADAKLDSTAESAYAEIKNPVSKLKAADDQYIPKALEELQAAFDDGKVSLNAYVTSLREKIKQIQGKNNLEKQDYANIDKLKKDITSATTKDILDKQSFALEIAKVYGASDSEVNLLEYKNNLDNLQNKQFNDPEEKTKAALAVLENLRKFNENLVKENKGTAEAQKLLAEGYQIPAEARFELAKSQVESSDTYKDLSVYVKALNTTSFGSITGKKGPGGLLDKALKEFTEKGVLSSETKDYYQGIYNKLNDALKAPNLTKSDQENIVGTMEYIKQVLILAGTLPTEPPPTDPANTPKLPEQKQKPRKPKEQRIQFEDGEKIGLDTRVSGTWDEADGMRRKDKDGRLWEFDLTNNQWVLVPPPIPTGGYAKELSEKAAAKKGLNLKPGIAKRVSADGQIGKIGKTTYKWSSKDHVWIEVPDELASKAGSISGILSGMIKRATDNAGFGVIVANATGKVSDSDSSAKSAADDAAAKAKKLADSIASAQDAAFNLRIAQLNKNDVAIAQVEIQKAQAQLGRARALVVDGDNVLASDKAAAISDAQAAVVKAQQGLNSAISSRAISAIGIAKAEAESNGQTVRAAELELQAANAELAQAKTTGEDTAAAQIAVINAKKKLADAKKEEIASLISYFSALNDGDDPVKQAKTALDAAQIQFNNAKGIVDKAEKGKALLAAQKQLRNAMQGAQNSMFDLRKAQLAAMDDDIGVAQLGVRQAREQLANAIKNKAGSAAINSAKAAVISAEKNAKNIIFQNKLDENQYLYDTGKQTKTEYIKYLQALQSTLNPASKQFKDLERTLYNLKNDIGSDLQTNLPTTLALPTLYEVRRLNQSGPQGYQDSRAQASVVTTNNNQTITINAAGANAEQVARIVSDTLGIGRNGSTVSRY